MIKTRPLCCVCLCFLIVQAIILIAISGKSMSEIPASSIFYDENEKSVLIHGQVYKKASLSKFQVLYLKNNSVSDSHIMVYDDNFIEVAIGQTVSLQGTTSCFDEARNPGNFDQRFYYAKQDIYGVVWCEKVMEISGEKKQLLEGLYQFKLSWKANIYEAIGEEEGSVLSAMLLGEKGDMEPEMKELYQKNGIGHILAISGLHISFIGLGIYKIIRRTGLGYIPSGVLAIFVLSLYALMIGFSVSVIRAYVMLLFRIGADMSGRVYDMLTALMVAAAITVGIQPLYLMDAGFLLSYGAILGILFVLPMLEKIFRCRKKFFSGVLASVAINIMLFPIMLWFYYEIPTYSMVLNFIIIPLTSVLLGGGMIGSLIGFVIWPVGNLCLYACKFILSVFEMLNRVGSKLPCWRMVMGQPEIWQIMLYYLVLAIGIFVIERSRKRKQRKVLFGVLCVSLCFVTFLMAYRPAGNLTVTMLDVGQGDSIFLRGPEGNTYLIDGGSSDVEQLGKYRMEPFLKSQGVGTLDYVFVTHGDTDHYSGIEEMLLRRDVGVEIRHLVLPPNWERDDALVELAQTAQEAGVPVAVIEAGTCITEGELRLECIQPASSDRRLDGNAGSMVLSVALGEFSLLCTGDVEAEGENVLMRKLQGQNFTVLKVAHHGSKHSSSEAFLRVARPKIAIISSGENNSYGHPHQETLKRLKDIRCQIYETVQNGAITLQTDGNTLTIDRFLY